MKRETLVSKQTQKGMPRPPGAGRKPGTPNKFTTEARTVFTEVFERLGGVDAMLRWAQESPQNLYAFYVKIYPKLLPNNPVDPSNTMVLERIERVIIHHDPEKARRGVVDEADPGAPESLRPRS